MKSLGIVQDMNHKGELLLRTPSAQRPGTWVFDRNKAKIGHVIRTIGPVKSPYLLVKVTGIPDREKMGLIQAELFSDTEQESRARMKKRGSKHGKKKRRSR